MSYTTAAEIATYLEQLDANNAATAALLDDMAERATAMIDARLGFSFAGYANPAVARAVMARPGPWLYLPAHEPESVTLVATADGTDLEGAWVEVVEAHGRVHKLEAAEGGYLWDWCTDRDATSAACGLSPYYAYPQLAQRRRRVTYNVTAAWGYGPPPPSIVEVTLEVAVNIWRSKDSGGFAENIGVQSGGAVSIAQHVAGLSGSQQAIVDAVRRQYAPELPLEAVLL